MAMTFILKHNENIYSLDEKETINLQKPPRYNSIYRPQVRKETKTNKTGINKTMGYAEVPLDSPDKFLKIGHGIHAIVPKSDHIHYKRNLPPIPKQKSKSAGVGGRGGGGGGGGGGEGGSGCIKFQDCANKDNIICCTGRRINSAKVETDCGKNHEPNDCKNKKHSELQSTAKTNIKNFKKKNIDLARKSAPIHKTPRYVDTKNGDFHDLKKSGLMPCHIFQNNYGKLPKYLIKRIRDVSAQEELQRDEDSRKQPLCRYVTQEERTELLGGLKHNWEELQQIYQGLPVLTDTIPKMLYKTKLEDNLKQLEKDILLVENHPYIYVYDN